MKINHFFKQIATSPARSIRRRAIFKEILNRDHANRDVVNLHIIDPNNVGDYFCSPHHYFEELKNKGADLNKYKTSTIEETQNWINIISDNSLIIGGGGLLNRGSFEQPMRTFAGLKRKNKKTVLWGVGHNSKFKTNFRINNSYNIDPDNFGLAGTRDYTLSKNWVPCVSCLHPIFNKNFRETQEIGIVFHKKTLKKPKLLKNFENYPCSSNTTNLESLINFIGSSEKIITDSYHVMYWAMLLEKKVVVVPNSSKFFDFKYQPVKSTFHESINDLKKAISYTGVLEECREINLQFSKKVFDYLKI